MSFSHHISTRYELRPKFVSCFEWKVVTSSNVTNLGRSLWHRRQVLNLLDFAHECSHSVVYYRARDLRVQRFLQMPKNKQHHIGRKVMRAVSIYQEIKPILCDEALEQFWMVLSDSETLSSEGDDSGTFEIRSNGPRGFPSMERLTDALRAIFTERMLRC